MRLIARSGLQTNGSRNSPIQHGRWKWRIIVPLIQWKEVTELVSDTGYKADGQTKEIRHANGVVTRFTYSPVRRWLTRIETLAPGGMPVPMGERRSA